MEVQKADRTHAGGRRRLRAGTNAPTGTLICVSRPRWSQGAAPRALGMHCFKSQRLPSAPGSVRRPCG
jgi:hypothetical protein